MGFLMANIVGRILSTSTGQDSILGSIEYFSHALHYLFTSQQWIRLQRRLGFPARRKSDIALESVGRSPSSSLMLLSSLLSDTRYTLRLFGLVSLWTQTSEIIQTPPEDAAIHALEVIQLLASIVYQLLENVAYLASKNILPRRIIEKWSDIDRWYMWSARGLLIHMLLQLGKLWREKTLRRRREETSTSSISLTKSVDGARMAVKTQEARGLEILAWRKDLFSSSVWALLCLNWSYGGGIGIPDKVTGALSLLADSVVLRDLWKMDDVVGGFRMG
ncbi:Peroxisomal biogenesis factor 11 [Penicillium alfredii]|uniref:Peroxisomal biogenesis factor 11 n=1 Tax=Penicillium alfredii TaxID=1506179 RepID=A0A9W9FTW8_9EURO|nr:Peroxisomal biogenesis factor 11 [Penicillium alfredii]KAJ5105757.1 Peroxisomal biogenesis factor 11 [Penicillium alfredii]